MYGDNVDDILTADDIGSLLTSLEMNGEDLPENTLLIAKALVDHTKQLELALIGILASAMNDASAYDFEPEVISMLESKMLPSEKTLYDMAVDFLEIRRALLGATYVRIQNPYLANLKVIFETKMQYLAELESRLADLKK